MWIHALVLNVNLFTCKIANMLNIRLRTYIPHKNRAVFVRYISEVYVI